MEYFLSKIGFKESIKDALNRVNAGQNLYSYKEMKPASNKKIHMDPNFSLLSEENTCLAKHIFEPSTKMLLTLKGNYKIKYNISKTEAS